MSFSPCKDTYKNCPKCNIRYASILNAYCEDCKPRFRKRKCYKHVFSLLDVDTNRLIKCKTCNETRKI